MRWPTWYLPSERCLRGFPYLVPNFTVLKVFDNIDDITIYTRDKKTFAEKYIKEKKNLHFNHLHPTFNFET